MITENIEIREGIQNKGMVTEYVYRGDRQTAESLRGGKCSAVRRPDGKCVRGKNGSMLVSFDGKKTIVIGRLLRKFKVQGSMLRPD